MAGDQYKAMTISGRRVIERTNDDPNAYFETNSR